MPTPRANVLRTVLQVIVAVLVVFPIALAKVPIPSNYQGSVALVLGIAAGVLVLVTAIQNVIETKLGVALFRSPQAVPLDHDAVDDGPPARRAKKPVVRRNTGPPAGGLP